MSTRPRYYTSHVSAVIPPFLVAKGGEGETEAKEHTPASFKTPQPFNRSTSNNLIVRSGELHFSTPVSQNSVIQLSPIENIAEESSSFAIEINNEISFSDVQSDKKHGKDKSPLQYMYKTSTTSQSSSNGDKTFKISPNKSPPQSNKTSSMTEQRSSRDTHTTQNQRTTFFDKYKVDRIDLTTLNPESQTSSTEVQCNDPKEDSENLPNKLVEYPDSGRRADIDISMEGEGLKKLKQKQRELEHKEREKKIKELQIRREQQKLELLEKESRMIDKKDDQTRDALNDIRVQERILEERKKELAQREQTYKFKSESVFTPTTDSEVKVLPESNFQTELERIIQKRRERTQLASASDHVSSSSSANLFKSAAITSRFSVPDVSPYTPPTRDIGSDKYISSLSQSTIDLVGSVSEQTVPIITTDNGPILNYSSSLTANIDTSLNDEVEIMENFLSTTTPTKQSIVMPETITSDIKDEFYISPVYTLGNYTQKSPLFENEIMLEDASRQLLSAPRNDPYVSWNEYYQSPDFSTNKRLGFVDLNGNSFSQIVGNPITLDDTDDLEINAFLSSLTPEKPAKNPNINQSTGNADKVESLDEMKVRKEPLSTSAKEVNTIESTIDSHTSRNGSLSNRPPLATNRDNTQIAAPFRTKIDIEMNETTFNEGSSWRITDQRAEQFQARHYISKETIEIFENNHYSPMTDEETQTEFVGEDDQPPVPNERGFSHRASTLDLQVPLNGCDPTRSQESPSQRASMRIGSSSRILNNGSAFMPLSPLDQRIGGSPLAVRSYSTPGPGAEPPIFQFSDKGLQSLVKHSITLRDSEIEGGSRQAMKLIISGNFLQSIRKNELLSRLLKNEEELLNVVASGETFWKCTPNGVMSKAHKRFFFVDHINGTMAWCSAQNKKASSTTTPGATRTIALRDVMSVVCLELPSLLAVRYGAKKSKSNRSIMYGLVIESRGRVMELIMDADVFAACKWLVGLCLAVHKAKPNQL